LFGLFLRQNGSGEGKKKLIELLQCIETDAKKNKKTSCTSRGLHYHQEGIGVIMKQGSKAKKPRGKNIK